MKTMNSSSSSLLLILLLLNLFFIYSNANHQITAKRKRKAPSKQLRFKPGPWKNAHATFYGGPDGSQTLQGACGYEDVVKQGYGIKTAALSETLFTKGGTCGACYEIMCFNDDKWCKKGAPSLHVTATNNCPPNYALASDNGGWCNPPREHFDLSQPAFLQIAEYKAGIIPVRYRRVPCQKKGGIKFTITGNPYFNMVMIWNVGGAGDVTGVQVKGNKKLKWTTLDRNWGQKWVTNAMLSGESLTFRIQTSDGRKLTSWHIVPQNWQFGQTFEGKNFR
ncbi:expansin-A4-like [Impatiens glandulifera]|uniref:expansin-A4-like n=1 Tax=Impatiens glandulifera TaxID=253017 RepID=UPI001FB0E3C7|nr:expansin-A4-like [Impatiens glandulifera]